MHVFKSQLLPFENIWSVERLQILNGWLDNHLKNVVFPLECDVFNEFMADVADKFFFVSDGLVGFGESVGMDALCSYIVLSRHKILLFFVFKPRFILFLVTNIPRILSVDFTFS